MATSPASAAERSADRAPTAFDETYTRLPGRGLKFTTVLVGGDRQSLYLGSDHVLAVRRSGYDESAKRFYLGDIQSITLQTNGAQAVFAVVFGLLFSLFALLLALVLTVAAADVQVVLGGILGVLAAFFGAVFIINIALGPTCTVNLHTAVQIEPLSALSRVRWARKCLRMLVPQIRAAQASQGGDARAAVVSPAAVVRASANVRSFVDGTPVKAVGARWPIAAYALMFAFAASAAIDLIYMHPLKDMLDAVLYFVLVGALMVVVVRQHNSTLPAACRRTNWIALVFNAVAFMMMLYVASIVQALEMQDEPPSITYFNVPRTSNMPDWIYYVTAGMGAINAVIAVFGFASLRGYEVITAGADSDGDGPP